MSTSLHSLSSHVDTLDTGLGNIADKNAELSAEVVKVEQELKASLRPAHMTDPQKNRAFSNLAALTYLARRPRGLSNFSSQGYIDTKHEDAYERAVSHTNVTISDAVEDLETKQAGKLETFEARFDAVEEKYNEANTYTYSYDGTIAIDQYSLYQFVLDYNLPGSSGSGYASNWFIEIEAYMMHCGGGELGSRAPYESWRHMPLLVDFEDGLHRERWARC